MKEIIKAVVRNIPFIAKDLAKQFANKFRDGFAIINIGWVDYIEQFARSLITRCNLKPKNQPVEVFPRSARPAKTL